MFASEYLREVASITAAIDVDNIERMAKGLAAVKKCGGRIFFLGVGGSAAAASHAVNDFRKIVGMECYAPTDNVSELTARTNDDGWHTVFSNWLRTSRLKSGDAIFVFSVGGGDLERKVSVNLIEAIDYAKTVGAAVMGVVGRDGGYLARNSYPSVIIPTINKDRVTPHTEEFHMIVLHLLVSHPLLKEHQTTWERKQSF